MEEQHLRQTTHGEMDNLHTFKATVLPKNKPLASFTAGMMHGVGQNPETSVLTYWSLC